MEKALLGLFAVILLLLVVMPALLYLTGWAVKRVTAKQPARISLPAAPPNLRDTPDGAAPAHVEASSRRT
jgi:hypothetical protein